MVAGGEAEEAFGVCGVLWLFSGLILGVDGVYVGVRVGVSISPPFTDLREWGVVSE